MYIENWVIYHFCVTCRHHSLSMDLMTESVACSAVYLVCCLRLSLIAQAANSPCNTQWSQLYIISLNLSQPVEKLLYFSEAQLIGQSLGFLESIIVKSVVVCRVKGRRVIHHFFLCIPEVHESIVFSHISFCPTLSYSVISQTLREGPTNDTLLNHEGRSQSLIKENLPRPTKLPSVLHMKETIKS